MSSGSRERPGPGCCPRFQAQAAQQDVIETADERRARKGVLRAHQAAVEEAERGRHQEHQRCRDQDECGVAAVSKPPPWNRTPESKKRGRLGAEQEEGRKALTGHGFRHAAARKPGATISDRNVALRVEHDCQRLKG